MAQKGQSQINLPKHKTISQSTNQFPETQISLPKHKTISLKHKPISQSTNQFTETQNSFSKHKPISRNTNQFTETQNNFSKHKPIFPKHKSKDWALASWLSERAWKGLIPRIFRVQHGDCYSAVDDLTKMFCHNCGSEVLEDYLYCSQCGKKLEIAVPSFRLLLSSENVTEKEAIEYGGPFWSKLNEIFLSAYSIILTGCLFYVTVYISFYILP